MGSACSNSKSVAVIKPVKKGDKEQSQLLIAPAPSQETPNDTRENRDETPKQASENMSFDKQDAEKLEEPEMIKPVSKNQVKQLVFAPVEPKKVKGNKVLPQIEKKKSKPKQYNFSGPEVVVVEQYKFSQQPDVIVVDFMESAPSPQFEAHQDKNYKPIGKFQFIDDNSGEQHMIDVSKEKENNTTDLTFEGNTIIWNHFDSGENTGIQSKTINLDVSAAQGDKMIHLSITNWVSKERTEDYNGYLWLNVDSQEIEFLIPQSQNTQKVKKTINVRGELEWSGNVLVDLRSCYDKQNGEVWFQQGRKTIGNQKFQHEVFKSGFTQLEQNLYTNGQCVDVCQTEYN